MNADLKRIRTEAETAVLEAFIDLENDLPGKAETHAARRGRMALFEQAGLPHRRIEEWKFTDLRSFMRTFGPVADGTAEIAAPQPIIENALQIALIDGALKSVSELPEGIALFSLGEALEAGLVDLDGPATPDRALDALNASFVRDGAVIQVADGIELEAPIELIFLRSPKPEFAAARVHVLVGEGASVTVVERHVSEADVQSQSSVVTRYAVGKGAKTDVLRLQQEGQTAQHLGEIAFDIDGEAEARLLHLNTGAKMARVETRASFWNTGARFDLAGITMAKDRQHNDLTLYVDHLVPECESTETFKTVVDGMAKSVFQGKIVVAQDAQKTDAQMSTDALLLSETSDMIAKPELEIFADDVSCAHGATCGEIDEDLMFYLLARGIPRPEAKKLLLQAFLSEGAELFDDHPFQQIAFDTVEQWLSQHAAS
ncbi:MAG: Fe-S cluster assembly protein SufD [Pseudomonadota bacterium]